MTTPSGTPNGIFSSRSISLMARSATGSGIFASRALVAVLVHLALPLVALAEFLLDGLHLFAQQKLALGFAHLFFDAAADVLLDLQDLELFGQQQAEFLQALLRVQSLQQFLLGLDAQRRQVPGDMVGQAARLLDVEQGDDDFRGDVFAGVGDLLKLRDDRAHQGFGFQRLHRDAGQPLDADLKKRLGLQPLGDADPLLAFQHDAHGAVGDFQDLHDFGDDADLIQIVRLRVFRRPPAAGRPAECAGCRPWLRPERARTFRARQRAER